MKRNELNNFGVQELNSAEMKKIEGGGILSDLLGAVTSTVGTVVGETFQYVSKQINNVLSLIGSL